MEGGQQPRGAPEPGPEATPQPAAQGPAPAGQAPRGRPRRQPSTVEKVNSAVFPLALRGYDRAAVDQHLAEVAQLVAELEATQSREGIIQRALDEVGEQTSSILQRANETADELAAQSRAQAEGRIQRAEREAEMIRQEADRYAEQISEDTRQMWEERMRLIDEMRQFAEDVLAVADDALDRLPRPADQAQPGQGDVPSGPTLVVPPQPEVDAEPAEAEGVIEVEPPRESS